MATNQTVINCTTASIDELRDALRNHTPISGVTMLGTHYGAHNDEIFGFYILQTTPEGKHAFPGIENASIATVSVTQLRTGEWIGRHGFYKALQNGILLVGVGGGIFDEHSDRAQKKSCAQLIFDYLEILKQKNGRKLYAKLLHYVNFEDNNGDNIIKSLNRANAEHVLTTNEAQVAKLLQMGCFAQNLKKGFEAAGSDLGEQKKIYDFAYQFYHHEIEQTKLFLTAEREYTKNNGQVHSLTLPGHETSAVLLHVKSDNTQMNKVVHSKWHANDKEKLAVLFLQKTNGQFVLMPSNGVTSEQMREVVKVLRQKVAQLTKIKIEFKDLGREEIIDQVPEIHFAEATGTISNGSKVDPEVPGLIKTGMLREIDVIHAIKIGLGHREFHEDYEKGCREGVCVKGRCPFYNFGLERCFAIRKCSTQIENALQKVRVA